MTTHDGGKGDMQRPLGVTMDDFDKSWDAIFNKDKPTSINIEVEADNDGQQITVTKTWEIG